jgi:hypothetical protein
VRRDSNHWAEVERMAEERKKRDEDIETRKEDAAREREDREKIRKVEENEVKEDLMRKLEEKNKIIEERNEMERLGYQEEYRDGLRTSYKNKIKKIGRDRKKDKERLEKI